ncbi:hypothetical protein [Ruminococcus sp.]|uniref:hypothetical protein n=1 Tax=Ruminococcus sp. TaxID=41978 RepID=UPI0025E2F0D0|nr:hypothetical protein [Ruminococcus sp.]MBQ6250189.1 hypothetical protein [Ruminococcus sp.]
MTEYISKHEAYTMMKDLEAAYIYPPVKEAYGTAARRIDQMPATDVQPVVRCKDCKHRKERHYEESGEKPYIKYECKFTKYSMSDDSFCSFGARMDGDTNG